MLRNWSLILRFCPLRRHEMIAFALKCTMLHWEPYIETRSNVPSVIPWDVSRNPAAIHHHKHLRYRYIILVVWLDWLETSIMLSVLWTCSVSVLVIVPPDEGKLYITMHLLVFEWLYIPHTVTGIFDLLFMTFNDSSRVIVPNKVAVSFCYASSCESQPWGLPAWWWSCALRNSYCRCFLI